MAAMCSYCGDLGCVALEVCSKEVASRDTVKAVSPASKGIYNELGSINWMGASYEWDQAIDAVRKYIRGTL